MGTSTSNKGTRGKNTPLIPTWLNPESSEFPSTETSPEASTDDSSNLNPEVPIPPNYPPMPQAADPNRFRVVRSNFSRFASSGGTDKSSLGRAVSGYVRQTTGGAKNAARGMGSSRQSAASIAGFLSDVASRGVETVLRSLKLDSLVGRPVEDIFLGLRDYICPEGSTVDAGIATDSFVKTIDELSAAGITDLNSLNVEQIQTVLEIYMTHTIEEKLYNEIGTNTITLPEDASEVETVQQQLCDFIKNGVSDALTNVNTQINGLTQTQLLGFVDKVYEESFNLLVAMGNAEAK